MFVDNYCRSYKIISVTLKRLLKTQSFGIKAILPVNKITWPFFIVLLIMTNDREQFKRVQNFFDKYCANYKIIPLRPKRSTKKLFKKRLIILWKKDFAFFFLLLQREADTKEQSIRVHKDNLTKIVQAKSLIPKDLRGRLQKTFQKKAVRLLTKVFALFLWCFPSKTELKEQLIKRQNGLW